MPVLLRVLRWVALCYVGLVVLFALSFALSGCAYFETQPAGQPSAAGQAAILDWALWAPRPRAQYAQPGYSDPVLVHQVDRNGFSSRAGSTTLFTRY